MEQQPTNFKDDLLANPFGSSDDLPKTEETAKTEKVIDQLTEEDKEKAIQLAKQIDPNDQQAIIAFGTEAQKKLHDLSHSMLKHVENKDVGEIGSVLKDLMKKLEEVNPEELAPEKQGFFARIFGKLSRSVNEILTKYQKTGAQIDRISVKLERSKDALVHDNRLLQELFVKNK